MIAKVFFFLIYGNVVKVLFYFSLKKDFTFLKKITILMIYVKNFRFMNADSQKTTCNHYVLYERKHCCP